MKEESSNTSQAGGVQDRGMFRFIRIFIIFPIYIKFNVKLSLYNERDNVVTKRQIPCGFGYVHESNVELC